MEKSRRRAAFAAALGQPSAKWRIAPVTPRQNVVFHTFSAFRQIRQYVTARSLPHQWQLQKLNERTGNVYENKGSLCKTRKRTGNVYENKGT
jgi:hypothetical protein